MIESREKRKKSSLFRRRIIIIVVSAILLLATSITLFSVYNFVNTVIYYTDEADDTRYYIKNNGEKWIMYDADDNVLKKEDNFNYYVTDAGTLVKVNEETGEYSTQAKLDVGEGEIGDHERILIFNHLSQANIRSIEVHNALDDYTFYRYNIAEKKIDDSADFVFRGSPQITIRRDALTALASDAGYPLAVDYVRKPVTNADGSTDYSEYGLIPEKRTRTIIDEDGNEVEEEYDYTPAYYIVTDTSGNQYKMLIGDRLINGGGYYAQYVDMSDGKETLRARVYILASSIKSTLLAEAKNFITPGIAYPTTKNDYFDVTDFEIKKLNQSGEYEKIVGFTYENITDRTDTVKGNKPYVFNDERSNSYHPNFDRIDYALLDLMEPEIIDVMAIHPSKSDLAEYGLMTKELDENGNPVLDENGNEKYFFNSKYTISFKRSVPVSANGESNSKINFLQVIYVSDKNENGNFYSYTTLTLLEDTDSDSIGFDLDMICEVASSTFNFLTYETDDWTYNAFMQTGIKYATNLTVTKNDYSVSFDINNLKEGDFNAISVDASDSNGRAVETFGMLNVKDHEGFLWHISRTDVKVFNGDEELFSEKDMKIEKNALGERTRYLTKPFKDMYGRAVYVNLNTIKIVDPDGKSRSCPRYQTMIFQKLYQGVNSLKIAGSYELEGDPALTVNPENLCATISLTDNENHTIVAEFYRLTDRKLYLVVNGEGGYYVSTKGIEKLFDDIESFFNCEDIQLST